MSEEWEADSAAGDLHLDGLKEGLCPRHGSALERRGDYGWCDECGSGWSLVGDEVRLHFELRLREGTTGEQA